MHIYINHGMLIMYSMYTVYASQYHCIHASPIHEQMLHTFRMTFYLHIYTQMQMPKISIDICNMHSALPHFSSTNTEKYQHTQAHHNKCKWTFSDSLVLAVWPEVAIRTLTGVAMGWAGFADTNGLMLTGVKGTDIGTAVSIITWASQEEFWV